MNSSSLLPDVSLRQFTAREDSCNLGFLILGSYPGNQGPASGPMIPVNETDPGVMQLSDSPHMALCLAGIHVGRDDLNERVILLIMMLVSYRVSPGIIKSPVR
jgi:hypothetical protein